MRRLVVHISYVLSLLGEYIGDMRAQKKRTALTMFGIVWGTAAVVVMMAVGTSVKHQNMTNFRGLGDAVILIFPGMTTKPYQGFGVDRRISLELSDVELLRREVAEISAVSEEFTRWNSFIRRGAQLKSPLVAVVNVEYGDMRNEIPEHGGRFINERDMAERRRVIFIGNKLKEYLFGEEEAVGKFVSLDGASFRVIGVLQKKVQNASYNTRDEERAFIPSTTFQAMYGDRYVGNIIAAHRAGWSSSRGTVKRIREVLGKKYVFDPTDESALGIWDTAEFFDEFLVFFNAFNVFLVLMGAMTLGVGGLGVSNIMYVVVRERTHEIGIKRAVGASRRTIMAQFFAETFFITFVGAAVGFAIAALITIVSAHLPGSVADAIGRPSINPLVAGVSVAIIAAVAFAAGYFPARKASRLDPVECLRY